jgi:hypothetical protein
VSSALSGWVQAAGAVLAGLAALLGAINRWHISRLRTEVNGQTHALVEVTHTLGIAEGVALERADPHASAQPEVTP